MWSKRKNSDFHGHYVLGTYVIYGYFLNFLVNLSKIATSVPTYIKQLTAHGLSENAYPFFSVSKRQTEECKFTNRLFLALIQKGRAHA